VLPVDRIIEALWADSPPAAAQTLVEADVERLNELLGDGVIVSHPWGYGLRAPVGGVDSDDFLRLVERARSEDQAVALETLREALALWRGPALADFIDRSFARAEIARLETARRVAKAEVLELTAPGRRGLKDGAEAADEPRERRLRSAAKTRWKVAAGATALIVVAVIAIVWSATRREEPPAVITGPNMVAAPVRCGSQTRPVRS
jgi:Bacterial transcriptional activator domain